MISHVTFQGHVIKESSDFVEGSSLLNLRTLPGLAAIGIMVVEVMLLIYHVAPRNHVFKEL